MSGFPIPTAGLAPRVRPGADRESGPPPRPVAPGAPAFGAMLAGMLGATRPAPATTPTSHPGAMAVTPGADPDAGNDASSTLPGDLPATTGADTAAAAMLPGVVTAGGIAARDAATSRSAAGGDSDHAVEVAEDDRDPRGGAAAGEEVGNGGAVGEPHARPAGTDADPGAHAAIMAAGAGGVPYRGLDGATPELRDRLQRVMDRMRDEHGVRVDVVETFRPQSRQDALHAQGRSAPGPVVTWTRNSRHTQGRAVDVMVNGGYTDTRAFATLQRVAREEGLHTLGMRDPGHLELPGNARGGAGVDLAALTRLAAGAGARVDDLDLPGTAHDAAQPTTVARPPHPAQVPTQARVAAVAQVASVATVATVAAVARVAAPGATTSLRGGPGAASRGTATGAAPATRPATAAAVDGGGTAAVAPGASGPAPDGSRSAATPIVARDAEGAERVAAQLAGASRTARRESDERDDTGRGGADDAAPRNLVDGGGGGREVTAHQPANRGAPVTGAGATDAMARLDLIDRLRDGSAARPLSQLTLSLDNAAGGTDRIRVGLRGSQVGAVLELSDQVLRDQVSSRLGELQGALEQRGLEAESLQVRRSAATMTEGLELTRVAGVAMEREGARGAAQNAANQGQGGQNGSGQPYTSQRERDGRQHRDPSTHDQPQRHNSRREPKEDRR